jgi:hypothetical protein
MQECNACGTAVRAVRPASLAASARLCGSKTLSSAPIEFKFMYASRKFKARHFTASKWSSHSKASAEQCLVQPHIAFKERNAACLPAAA